MRLRAYRIGQIATLAALCGAGASSASVRDPLRTVVYHGYSVSVPRTWPLYFLAKAPDTCVRFNRHALYLGVPGRDQQCPPHAVGRTEAILIEPARISPAPDESAGVPPIDGSATTFIVRAVAVKVTATWLRAPQVIAKALHRRSLPAAAVDRPAARIAAHSSGGGSAAPTGGGFYTGPGFDVCDVPSAQQMSAWTAYSPYHAVGLYIGGANAACPPGPGNPNLTASWLGSEAAAGWHFVPIYVGLQAPSNSCGCAGINPSQASSQGTAAADDAVVQAESLGLPSGTPIYNDMEGYSDGGTNTSAVLAFLAAWTTELHAKGYVSGVYGSLGSTIHDLVTQYGTNYPEPDDVWFAAWPGAGSQTTSDPSIPSADWANHQRLHQYSGGHTETYGGVTFDIDGDYLDGAVAGSTSAAPPALTVSRSAGLTTSLTTSWSGLGLARWEVLAGTSPTAMTGIRSATLTGAQTTIAVRSAAPYFAVQALGSSNQVLATSSPVPAPTGVALFGHSSFVGESSLVGTVPVGCYLSTPCQIVATIYWGSKRLARSAPQSFRPGGSGLVYYRLNWLGRRLLAAFHNARLPVKVVVTDASGAAASSGEMVIPFATKGSTPTRSTSPSPTVSVVGTTDFVHGWAGGILVRCGTPGACWTTATLSARGVKIATARPQLIGGLELGYAFFSLTARGHQLLGQSPGSQLGASLVLSSGTSTAGGRIALVEF